MSHRRPQCLRDLRSKCDKIFITLLWASLNLKFFTILGALAYAELGTMIQSSGAEYSYFMVIECPDFVLGDNFQSMATLSDFSGGFRSVSRLHVQLGLYDDHKALAVGDHLSQVQKYIPRGF